jgi:hypothetical protein
LTFYRVPGAHAGLAGDGCSYFAPIAKMAITRGKTVEYDVFVTIGTPDQIRQTFADIRAVNVTS